jgi:hypothetical protein
MSYQPSSYEKALESLTHVDIKGEKELIERSTAPSSGRSASETTSSWCSSR